MNEDEVDLLNERVKIHYNFIVRNFPFRRPVTKCQAVLVVMFSEYRLVRWLLGGSWAKFVEDGFWHWVYPARLKILKTQPILLETYSNEETSNN